MRLMGHYDCLHNDFEIYTYLDYEMCLIVLFF